MTQETLTLHIPAIHCDGCLSTVRTIVEQSGAVFESGDPDTKRVTIAFDSDRLTGKQIEEALEAIGFPAEEESE